jgi:hypothetical protein
MSERHDPPMPKSDAALVAMVARLQKELAEWQARAAALNEELVSVREERDVLRGVGYGKQNYTGEPMPDPSKCDHFVICRRCGTRWPPEER